MTVKRFPRTRTSLPQDSLLKSGGVGRVAQTPRAASPYLPMKIIDTLNLGLERPRVFLDQHHCRGHDVGVLVG